MDYLFRTVKTLGSFALSSSLPSNSHTPSTLLFQQESNAPVFTEEYDSFVRACKILIFIEESPREQGSFSRSPWAIIFEFSNRYIKYELIKRNNGLTGPIWIDFGRTKSSSPLNKFLKVCRHDRIHGFNAFVFIRQFRSLSDHKN